MTSGISFAAEPADGRSAVLRALRAASASGVEGQTSSRSLVAVELGCILDSLRVAVPLPVYVAGAARLSKRTQRLTSAHCVGWQYAVVRGRSVIAIAELSIDKDHRSRVTTFIKGPRCGAFAAALRELDRLPAAQSSGELRALWVPAEQQRALWLHPGLGPDQLFFFAR